MGARISRVGVNQLPGTLLPWSGPPWRSESIPPIPYGKRQEEAKQEAEKSAFYKKYNEYDRLYAILNSLTKLQEDWDSYGAPSPSPASVTLGTKYLAAFLSKGLLPHRVVPSAEGGVALMFSSSPKQAYFEITNEEELSIGTYGKGQKLTITDLSSESDAAANAAKARDIISSFFEG